MLLLRTGFATGWKIDGFRDKGIWEKPLEKLARWLMIEATYSASAWSRGGMGRTKGGGNSKVHLAVDAPQQIAQPLIEEGMTIY